MNKFNITPFSCEQIQHFENYSEINGYILGNADFSLRYVHSFTIEEIKSLQTAKKKYLEMNKILHNDELNVAKNLLLDLVDHLDGVIFSDMAIYQIVKENNLKLEMIYSTETTITNRYFTEFAHELGIDCIDVAREINLKEAEEINNAKQSKVSYYIHGHIYMYQSLRKLLTNYYEHENKVYNEANYKLYDEERDLYYPIIENKQGTHVLAGSDLTTLPYLKQIVEIGFDYLKIDGFLYTEEDYSFLVELYIKAINDLDTNYQNQLEEKIDKKFGPGFLFKRTIY